MANDYSQMICGEEVTIISKKALAQKLGVSSSTIYRMMRAEQLPPPLKTPAGHIRGWFTKTINEWFETYTK
ncbi:AlpA family phage regulatory protein [Vibrio parahaemolyticus]|uniref:helix-turn-helix transcriptional regulator n=1 Tax=Vibrio harveyi group TaxID=717610 RepID=UPI00061AE440|nr:MULTISPECIES: AlpA family phage regulatory protein [Vibrio harveyi group]EGQ8142941.1 AlpA family phage regulatory protein [Vibrio parahaemolyticus]EGQ8336353.1 AlpA family phage regulatory protein [Vibrio parahaemolyticus]EGQ8370019.1 AlpA family phage regulatory protein [Vibrio parahaemolyticus]EGQ8722918.1 AlpA family phage regulatory protein [Vibrio parahaemolyticus]EGQ8761370.1 AlpA family phage regulatory protein [Vibrio parahaemolyticus]